MILDGEFVGEGVTLGDVLGDGDVLGVGDVAPLGDEVGDAEPVPVGEGVGAGLGQLVAIVHRASRHSSTAFRPGPWSDRAAPPGWSRLCPTARRALLIQNFPRRPPAAARPSP